jgi:hypothetical protein
VNLRKPRASFGIGQSRRGIERVNNLSPFERISRAIQNLISDISGSMPRNFRKLDANGKEYDFDNKIQDNAKIYAWGSGQEDAAAVSQRAANLTPQDVQAMIKEGLTKKDTEVWKGFYEDVLRNPVKAANLIAKPRLDLMNKILELWPKQ